MKSQAGFTLIEVIATGIIALVLASSILSILYLSNSKMKESLAYSKLHGMYEIGSEEIRRVSRRAAFAVGDEEKCHAPPTLAVTSGLDYRKLTLCTQTGDTLGSFSISDAGYLQYEFPLKSKTYIDVKVAGESIPIFEKKSFGIHANRRAVEFQLDIVATIAGTSYKVRNPSEVSLCRNTQN